jgi:hypothetical protein
LGEIGAAQAAEITNDDKMVAGKIDLITGLLLRTACGQRSKLYTVHSVDNNAQFANQFQSDGSIDSVSHGGVQARLIAEPDR